MSHNVCGHYRILASGERTWVRSHNRGGLWDLICKQDEEHNQESSHTGPRHRGITYGGWPKTKEYDWGGFGPPQMSSDDDALY
jgi:hypothetical protein